MKKRIAPVLLLVFVLLAAIGVLAACNESETRSDAAPDPTPVDYFTFEPNSTRDGYILTGTQKILPSDVVIPSEYMGLPVTTIGASAFEGCTEIESVQYDGTSVVTISPSAYKNCQSLQETALPSSLQTIGYSAFEQCSSLEKVVLPDSLQSLGASTFKNCVSLKSIAIPKQCSYIGDGSFINCSSLEKVTLQNGLAVIGENAFEKCTSLQAISFPESLRIVASGAFSNCTSLGEVTFNNRLEFIFANAFSSCTSLIELKLPASLIMLCSLELSPSAALLDMPQDEILQTITDFISSGALPSDYFAETPSDALEQNEHSKYSIIGGCSSLKTVEIAKTTSLTKGCLYGITEDGISLY